MPKKKPTPNYDLMFDRAVFSLQAALNEYKKSVCKELDHLFVTMDGRWGVLEGYDKTMLKTQELAAEVTRCKEEVERLRKMKGGTE